MRGSSPAIGPVAARSTLRATLRVAHSLPCRRGVVGEGLQWIPRLAAAAILLFLLFAQIMMLTSIQATPERLELALYQERLLNGPDGVWTKEPFTGRVLPGLLDLARLSEASLREAYGQPGDAELYGARLTLYLSEKALREGRPDLTTHHPEKAFIDSYLALGRAGLKGRGGALYERHVLPVVIGEPATLGGKDLAGRNAWLMIEAVKRR